MATHPGFAGAPIDRFTVALLPDHSVAFLGMSDFNYQATFGTPPADLPKSGSAIAHILHDDGFMVKATVLEADWRADGFTFRYRIENTGMTPMTDYTVVAHANISGTTMQLDWSMDGTQFGASIHATAVGALIANTVAPPPTGLPGIWSGDIQLEHPGFAGAPIDRMTIEVSSDGRLHFAGTADFNYEATFGAPPTDLPLSGDADAHILHGDGFIMHFTVLTADWRSDGFTFKYRVQNTAMTPLADVMVVLEASVVGDLLQVSFTEDGTWLTDPLHVVGCGELHK